MDNQVEPPKPTPVFQDFMENGFPALFYIFFPGLMIGFYISIPLGFVAAFVGFFMFRIHCHLLDIRSRLDTIIKRLPE
jgi:hypothetical protein